jgi:hypothetical protein
MAMQGDNHSAKIALRDERERIIVRLIESFAEDELGLEQFERRVEEAYRCSTAAALGELVADLRVARAAPPAEAPKTQLVLEAQSAELSAPSRALAQRPAATLSPRAGRGATTLAVFGSVERRGNWRIAETLTAYAIFGSVVLDFRDVELPSGVTELKVCAYFGSIEIIVPSDLTVECDGMSILGSFETASHVPTEGAAGLPILRISGIAVFGSVEVRSRPPAWVARMAEQLRGRRQLSP